MSSRTVLVVGDVMLDRYVCGTTAQIAAEAGTPIVRADKIVEFPGGAANVAMNLAAMGVETQLIGVVAKDEPGKRLHQMLCDAQRTTPLWPRLLLGEQATIVKTRIMAGNRQLLRVDDELPYKIDPIGFLQAVAAALAEVNVEIVVISDYNKGTLDCVREDLLRLCTGRKIVVDTKPDQFSAFAGSADRDITLTPNLAEALAYVRATGNLSPALLSTDKPTQAIACADVIKAQLGVTCIVTCHEFGAAYAHANREGAQFIYTCPQTSAFDVGAGDTFLAALVASRLADAPDTKTSVGWINDANLAAGLAVQQPMTSVVSRDMVLAHVYQKNLPHSKYMTQHALLDYVRRIRARDAGLTIGFTNGCFDLMHPGHVETLEFVRRRCSVMIVACNSDDSVARLKGPARPLVPQKFRMRLLEPFADAIFLLEQDNVRHLLELLKVDIYVKGAEYEDKALVEADIVAKYGGEVLYAPTVPGFSTTSLSSR